MAPLKERVTTRIAELRERRPFVDHLVVMQEHYGASKAGQQAGAVTYFGFLSFFPILALAFFVVGIVSNIYPDANQNLRDAIDSVLPGIVGGGEGQISLDDIRTFSGLAAVVGVLGVLYSGLGWLSAMRDALVVVFDTPQREQPNFVIGKLRDLATLAVIGFVLIISVAVAGFVGTFSDTVLGWIGLGSELGWLVKILTIVFGLAANAVLFAAMFRLLAEPHIPRRPLWTGALFGAIGFEILKQLSTFLLASTKNQPAFQAFGIALILLVWINYFSRVVLYAAAFAYTSPEAVAQRVAEPVDPVQGPQLPSLEHLADSGEVGAGPPSRAAAFVAGAATAVAAVAVLKRTTDKDDA